MPKTKAHSSTKKRFRVTGAGKIMRSARHRTTPPGHLVKRSPGSRKRHQHDQQVAPSDRRALRKLLGI
jgi:large subunit ribosomal protein L35